MGVPEWASVEGCKAKAPSCGRGLSIFVEEPVSLKNWRTKKPFNY
jgi:hypothetical protein